MAATETITMRVEPQYKIDVTAAAEAMGVTVTDFLVQAARLRMAASCSVCGRTDRPTAGAGLSEACTAFIDKITKDRDMQHVTVTATVGNKLVAYHARINLMEPSQGQLLMMLDFKQGTDSHTAEFPIPRGLITGWQQDSGRHHERLVSLGYANGNDAVIRGYLRGLRLRVVTVRVVLDAICAMPGITEQQLREYIGLYHANNALPVLEHRGLIQRSVSGGWGPVIPDPDAALQAARSHGINLDEQMN